MVSAFMFMLMVMVLVLVLVVVGIQRPRQKHHLVMVLGTMRQHDTVFPSMLGNGMGAGAT